MTLTLVPTLMVFGVLRTWLVREGGLPPVLARAYPLRSPGRGTLLAYGLLVLVHLWASFRILESRLPGRALAKGLRFGGMLAAIWAWGFLELPLCFGASLEAKVLSALRDGMTLLVFGLLLGRWWGTSTPTGPSPAWSSLPILALAFSLGHALQYFLVFPRLDPVGGWGLLWTLWVAGLGTLFALAWVLLAPRGGTGRTQGLSFLLTVGLNWMLYNGFYGLFLELPWVDVGIRGGLPLVCMVGVALGGVHRDRGRIP